MSEAIYKLAKELAEKTGKQIDEFIVNELLLLFNTDILRLEVTRPVTTWNTYPDRALKGEDNIHFEQGARLSFRGEEVLCEMRSEIQDLESKLSKAVEGLSFYISDGFECNACGSPDFREEDEPLCDMCEGTRKTLEEIEKGEK